MKYITIILLFLCLMSCHNGRQSSCENVPVEKDSVQLRVIPVSISDTAYRNVDQTFEQISYVVLSDNVVIGEIVRTLVSDERIFILDNQNKLFCFDMQGKVEYVIDEHGPGPNEYGNVLDFALNPPVEDVVDVRFNTQEVALLRYVYRQTSSIYLCRLYGTGTHGDLERLFFLFYGRSL